jgi:hypothetical protein
VIGEGTRFGNEHLVDRERAGPRRSQAVDVPRAIDDAGVIDREYGPEEGRPIVGRRAGETGADRDPLRVVDAAGEAPNGR